MIYPVDWLVLPPKAAGCAVPDKRVVTFVVEGEPKPKERPRLNRYSGEVYTPTHTRNWEGVMARKARDVMDYQKPMTGDLLLTLEFRRKDNRRADLDNLIKACDSFNSIVWNDDKQVVAIHARVLYASEQPGVTVTVQAA